MWQPQFFSVLAFAATSLASALGPYAPIDARAANITQLFQQNVQLTGGSFFQPGSQTPLRWSTYNAPKPSIVVNVRNEKDVAAVVKFCYFFRIPYLAQNGGSGWSADLNLDYGVLINLAGLNEFSPSADKTQTTIGGGLKINDTIAQAWENNLEIETGNCNCVGTLGAILGGGFGNLMGLYGFGIDNLISVRLVTPQGDVKTVTPTSDPDLWWAIRGAGPNFGIITSAVVRTYPKAQADAFAWTGGLVYDPSHLEDVVSAINNLVLQPEMNVFMYFISTGGPPVVLATPFLYQGNETAAHDLYASLYNIPHIADTTGKVTYNNYDLAADPTCARGARKPSFGVGMKHMVPSSWRAVWNAYADFQSKPGAQSSVILLEAYSLIKARSVPKDQQGSYPHRDYTNFNAAIIPWYNDSSLDAAALSFGSYARDQLRATADLGDGVNRTYVNFGFGDESNQIVYAESLPRLQSVKRRIDPTQSMSHWFPIKI